MNYGDTLYTIIVSEIENEENDRWLERGYREGSLRRFPIIPTDGALHPTVGAALRAFNKWNEEYNDGDWKLRGVYALSLVEDTGYGYTVNADKLDLDLEAE